MTANHTIPQLSILFNNGSSVTNKDPQHSSHKWNRVRIRKNHLDFLNQDYSRYENTAPATTPLMYRLDKIEFVNFIQKNPDPYQTEETGWDPVRKNCLDPQHCSELSRKKFTN
jgi:hypothetical protein